MNQGLKNGYYARPARMEDLEPMVKLFAAYDCSQIGAAGDSVEQVRVQWTSPRMDLADKTMAVFSHDHQPVGYIELWDNSDLHLRMFAWAAIHPEHWQRGIGQFLLDWVVDRARKIVPLAPQDARVVLLEAAENHNQAAYDLLTGNGFQHVRNSNIMRIDFNGPPPAPQPVNGIIIRPIQNDDEEREAIRVAFEAFIDHWGHVDEPFETVYTRRKYFIDHDPRHDPSLWFIALDGDEIAGVSLCEPYIDEDPEQGWVATLGVRRAWRKQGLGLALLQHSFSEFYRRGIPRAGLGVDASNLTGAMRLYERAGMHIKRSTRIFELELRAGRDLTTQAV